ncbi:unnamed protein product [Malus baccata var. baccata]
MFVCVRCVRVWLRALCVCTTFTIITCILFRPWMVVSFKTRWSIRAIQSIFVSSSSLTHFKVIPDPFQSLNTKGSIFKDNFNMFNVIYYFISLTIFKVIPGPFQSLNTKGSIFKDNFNMFNVIYYFISLTIFKAIPDPFQSLNTKGSTFKVNLQTYIYIIVIYTTTNKFVWTRMLIFLSN